MKFRVLSFVLLVLLATPLIAQIPVGSCTPMSFSGNWANATAYAKCAVVINQNSLYISLLANINSQPTSTNPNWMLLASPGGTSIPGLSSDGNNGIKVQGEVSAAGIATTGPGAGQIQVQDSSGKLWNCKVNGTSVNTTFTCTPVDGSGVISGDLGGSSLTVVPMSKVGGAQ